MKKILKMIKSPKIKTGKGLRNILTFSGLLGVILGLIGGTVIQVEAYPNPKVEKNIVKRVEAVRKMMGNQYKRSGQILDSKDKRPDQYYPWHNWPNWGNWGNWGNWRNW